MPEDLVLGFLILFVAKKQFDEAMKSCPHGDLSSHDRVPLSTLSRALCPVATPTNPKSWCVTVGVVSAPWPPLLSPYLDIERHITSEVDRLVPERIVRFQGPHVHAPERQIAEHVAALSIGPRRRRDEVHNPVELDQRAGDGPPALRGRFVHDARQRRWSDGD